MASAVLAVLAACTPLVARTAGPVGGLSIEPRGVEDDDRLCRTSRSS
jgi:hypothetical protein